jgi:hypothetical protein
MGNESANGSRYGADAAYSEAPAAINAAQPSIQRIHFVVTSKQGAFMITEGWYFTWERHL